MTDAKTPESSFAPRPWPHAHQTTREEAQAQWNRYAESEFEASDIPRDGERSAAYHAIADQLAVVERERDQFRSDASRLEAERDVLLYRVAELEAHVRDEQNLVGHLQRALHQIAAMPTEPRSDGSFNYSREALIDIARRATKETTDV